MYYLDDEVLYRAVVPAALVLVCAASLEAADSEAAFFATRIRPLLAHHCFACHTDCLTRLQEIWEKKVDFRPKTLKLRAAKNCQFLLQLCGRFHVSPSGLMSANVHPLITSINASGNSARS